MAEAWFFPLAFVLLYYEERGGFRHGGGGERAGEADPPKVIFVRGFGALAFAVGFACWRPWREAACGEETWIECFLCLDLLLLLFLGLGQLFLYVAMATGVAARRGGPRGLALTLARAAGVLVLVALSIAANCSFTAIAIDSFFSSKGAAVE